MDQDLCALRNHLGEIAMDPDAWLEVYLPWQRGEVGEILKAHAELLSILRRDAEDAGLQEWAERYGLDAGMPVTVFLRRLCTSTLAEVRRRLDTIECTQHDHDVDIGDLMRRLGCIPTSEGKTRASGTVATPPGLAGGGLPHA